MKTTFSVLCFGLMLFAVGCGGEDSPSSVVNKYHQAIMDKDIDAVMACMESDANRKGMEALLEFRSNGMKKGGLPAIVKEEINGDTATVTCKFGPMEQGVDLVKKDGSWKIK